MDKSKIYKNSKDEWYTPNNIIDYVNKISGGITLDPATTIANAKRMGIKKFYTKRTNGLNKDWSNEVVWLNPPFSNKNDWINKARYEVDNNNAKVYLLLPMSMETKIWQDCLLNKSIIHIPNKRISFMGGTSSPFGSCIIEMTKKKNNTYKTFKITEDSNGL